MARGQQKIQSQQKAAEKAAKLKKAVSFITQSLQAKDVWGAKFCDANANKMFRTNFFAMRMRIV